MVVLEPSCAAVFRDELPNMLPNDEDGKRITAQTFLLSEFLVQHAKGYEIPRLAGKALVQAHCHHKAIMKVDAEESVLKRAGLDYEVLDSGCCGMAGSFGFEKEKYGVSIACGERVLLPAVRNAPASTMIIANGFSCQEQIEQDTERHALHLAQVIATGIHERKGQTMNAGENPESTIIKRRKRAVRTSMFRAAAALACAALACGLLLRHRSR